MLTGLTVTSDLTTSSLELSLQDASNGYIIKEIAGLDPVKSNIVTSPMAGLDGVQFQANKRDARNIVLTLGIEPYSGGATVQDLRQALYNYFMPKANVSMTVKLDDYPFATIAGQVESFETPLFAKEPEIVVSILCFDPDFIDFYEQYVSSHTVSNTVETVINYAGSSPTGFLLEMDLNHGISGFDIYHRRPNLQLTTFSFLGTLNNADKVFVSSNTRDKFIKLKRGTDESSLLYGVSPQSKWPVLYPGENYFRVHTAYDDIPYSLKYRTRYGGL